MANLVNFLGLTNQVVVEGQKGMEQHDAVGGKTRFAVWQLDWTNPNSVMGNVPNMTAAGNGDYKPSGIKEVPVPVKIADDRIRRALELLDTVESALADKKIDAGEVVSIINKAGAVANGKELIGAGLMELVNMGSSLLSGVVGAVKKK